MSSQYDWRYLDSWLVVAAYRLTLSPLTWSPGLSPQPLAGSRLLLLP